MAPWSSRAWLAFEDSSLSEERSPGCHRSLRDMATAGEADPAGSATALAVGEWMVISPWFSPGVPKGFDPSANDRHNPGALLIQIA